MGHAAGMRPEKAKSWVMLLVTESSGLPTTLLFNEHLCYTKFYYFLGMVSRNILVYFNGSDWVLVLRNSTCNEHPECHETVSVVIYI